MFHSCSGIVCTGDKDRGVYLLSLAIGRDSMMNSKRNYLLLYPGIHQFAGRMIFRGYRFFVMVTFLIKDVGRTLRSADLNHWSVGIGMSRFPGYPTNHIERSQGRMSPSRRFCISMPVSWRPVRKILYYIKAVTHSECLVGTNRDLTRLRRLQPG